MTGDIDTDRWHADVRRLGTGQRLDTRLRLLYRRRRRKGLERLYLVALRDLYTEESRTTQAHDDEHRGDDRTRAGPGCS